MAGLVARVDGGADRFRVTHDRARRVTVSGSESTGKTWLAERLAIHFGTVWSPEFSRDYALQKGAPLDASDVEPIARGQMRAEDEMLRRAQGLAILDTDLVSTVVYAEHYYGQCPRWIEEEARARLADLYLLCQSDVAWVADPARDRPHARHEIHTAIAERLQRFGATSVVVRGRWDAREATAIAAIESRLGLRSPEHR